MADDLTERLRRWFGSSWGLDNDLSAAIQVMESQERRIERKDGELAAVQAAWESTGARLQAAEDEIARLNAETERLTNQAQFGVRAVGELQRLTDGIRQHRSDCAGDLDVTAHLADLALWALIGSEGPEPDHPTQETP